MAKIDVNRSALGAVLRSAGTQTVLTAEARRIAASAGDGNVVRTGRGRAAVVSYKGKHSLKGLNRASGR